MAIIDVVKYEQNDGEIVYRFPSAGLRWGTRLVVYPGQVAFFAKGGKICDEFKEGTYTLSTNNIPILNRIVNLPYGGESPFQADVWFVNLLTKLDFKWGTETPIQIEDPKYKIILPIRAYGQYGFRISNPRCFITKLSGNRSTFDNVTLQSYFRGILLGNLTNIISEKIISEEISFLEINSKLLDISHFAQERLHSMFELYGVDLVDFTIISINVPENDESLKVLKNAKSTQARLAVTGTETYKMERTYDVLDAAAKNESGAGNFLNAGVGLGAGAMLGNQLVSRTAVSVDSNVPPSLPTSIYYLGVNNSTNGPYSKEEIQSFIDENRISATTLCWKKGMKEWAMLENFKEFSFDSSCPPPLPKM